MRGRSSKSTLSWLDAEDVPRRGSVGARPSERRVKFMRRYVIAAAVLFPIAVLTIILAYTRDVATAKVPSQADTVTSPGRPVAEHALVQWLSGPSALPGGSVLLWSGATREAGPSPKDDGDVAYDLEIDHFVVTDAQGSLYGADVQVALDPRGGAKVVGGPSLSPMPTPGSGNWDSGGPWPGLATGDSPSQTVTSVIKSWSVAFASGDPGQLRIAVGDPNPTHSYIPLPGVASCAAEVSAAATLGKGQLIVRVALMMTWESAPADTTSDPETSGATTPAPTGPAATSTAANAAVATYDLLIADASSGAPRVVAWGGPGTGPTLRAYQNAVADVPRLSTSVGSSPPSAPTN